MFRMIEIRMNHFLLENRICVAFVMTGSRNLRRKIISIIMSVKVNAILFYAHVVIKITMNVTETIIFTDNNKSEFWI